MNIALILHLRKIVVDLTKRKSTQRNSKRTSTIKNKMLENFFIKQRRGGSKEEIVVFLTRFCAMWTVFL